MNQAHSAITADYFVGITRQVIGLDGSVGGADEEPAYVHDVVIGGVQVTIDGDPVVVIF